ncbi:MAG: collagen-like protein [Clostridia bacterium]|nr:collagen-like protein [Clostridia bacterium]
MKKILQKLSALGLALTLTVPFLASCGADGAQGPQGEAGKDGANGKSAYELAVENGYTGSLQDWLNSLVGAAGTNGTNGENGKDGVEIEDIRITYEVSDDGTQYSVFQIFYSDGTSDIRRAELPPVVTNAETLKAALAEAESGDVILLQADITVGEKLSVPAGVTINGNGHALKQVSLTLSDRSVLKNIAFSDNRTENASYVYAHNATVTIDGCSFDSPDWDALQLTADVAGDIVLTVKNCTFTDSKDIAYRYIHVEVTDKEVAANADNGIKLVLENNTFVDITNCDEDAITICGVFKSNLAVSGNKGVDASEVWVGVRNADDANLAWTQYTASEIFG